MAMIAATAVFTARRLSINWDLLRLTGRNAASREWSEHVEKAYQKALEFCLNEFYIRDLKPKYLFGAPMQGPPHVGELWADWVLLCNKRLGTESLHVSFHFHNASPDPSDPECPVVEAIARFMAEVYALPESRQSANAALLVLGTELNRNAPHRRHALNLSRYVMTSLYGMDPKSPSPVGDLGLRVNAYRLLYQHALGADIRSADQKLGPAWRSTAFFELYMQPGAILAISTPYPPELWHAHRDWFVPQPTNFALTKKGLPEDASYEKYDLLPEYPPLRHLGLLYLEYAAVVEETLRATQEATFCSWYRRRPLGGHFRRYLLASVLEGIRLPVVRSLVSDLLDNKQQERTISAVTTGTNWRLAVLALVFTVIALLFSLVALISPLPSSSAPPTDAAAGSATKSEEATHGKPAKP